MPNYSVSVTDEQDAVLDVEASRQSVTKTQLISATAQKEITSLELKHYNNWWSALDVSQKKIIWEANQV